MEGGMVQTGRKSDILDRGASLTLNEGRAANMPDRLGRTQVWHCGLGDRVFESEARKAAVRVVMRGVMPKLERRRSLREWDGEAVLHFPIPGLPKQGVLVGWVPVRRVARRAAGWVPV